MSPERAYPTPSCSNAASGYPLARPRRIVRSRPSALMVFGWRQHAERMRIRCGSKTKTTLAGLDLALHELGALEDPIAERRGGVLGARLAADPALDHAGERRTLGARGALVEVALDLEPIGRRELTVDEGVEGTKGITA